MLFNLGQTVMTKGVSDFLEERDIPVGVLSQLLMRHSVGDWGDMPEEDKDSNNRALLNNGRLMSSYDLRGESVWVITEWDRSVTTVLFPHEY